MSTPALRELSALGIPHTIHSYTHDPRERSFGTEAARKLDLDETHVYKTIIFLIDERTPVAAIVPVSTQVDTKALARALDVKRVESCPVTTAERLTGYVVGGISPFGQKTRARTVVDESAGMLGRMYVSAGRRGLEVSLSPADLVAVTGAAVAPIATGHG